MAGKLSIVATPIGNLEDITLRALRVLKEADVIYCEDTRVTSKLLARYDIHTPLKRLDANVEAERTQEVIERLERGEHVAYVTDAGTPGISDPGSRLVAAVRRASSQHPLPQRSSGLPCSPSGELRARPFASEDVAPTIECVPGPSALAAALSIAGAKTDEFVFLGFLPHKKGRQTALKEIAASQRATVLYESSHRIAKLVSELAQYAPGKRVTIVREVTKLHEEVLQGLPHELEAALQADANKTRGEFVVIVE